MKKTIYISGIIIVNILLLGCMFKIFHWPGANVMIVLSLTSLAFWFIPSALINNYQGTGKKQLMLYVATFITFFIVFIGAMFKIMHWPGASIFLLIGVPIPFLIFLPVYLYYNLKEQDESHVNFIAIILGLTFIGVYSTLLAINVSKHVLEQGVELVNTNQRVIDQYKINNQNYSNDILKINQQNSLLVDVHDNCNDIYDLIAKAENQLLNYSGNEQVNSLDAGNLNFENAKHLESMSSQYILFWIDEAIVPVLKDKISNLKEKMLRLEIDDALKQSMRLCLFTEDIEIEGDNYSWEQREFSSDYMLFSLEALTRLEKNIRFIENSILNQFSKNQDVEFVQVTNN